MIFLRQAEESKIQGNECMKNDKFFEAILHYTKAIKLESDNPPFYSNRSLAFLKIQQYNYALEDAKTVIKLMPKWMKVE
ncbi:hypothetical protein CAPTEDRAFT_143086 [Capitella teleta]|uniref:Uncharacterized protein n=1 Tax=Capitella teleta TaxID=283909 RepID=R7TSE6_CAPTE|nr:hypothetical protein CAPTEDRAFT_143086 [Capitella teleta]|eukprot:ELT96532.1 hypothetical protein CAPTEDRAFT_143086 [Capitella teleta]